MNNQFTKGEWKHTPRTESEASVLYIFVEGNSRPLASMIFFPERLTIETQANITLMTSAPDLLEALENIENDDNRIPATIWDMRNKAIAKARGLDDTKREV